MDDNFFTDLDRLRLNDVQQQAHHKPLKDEHNALGTCRVRGEFLKGPIPLSWLSGALKLNGKSPAAVALAIMFEVGRRKSNTITLTTAICERFFVNRKAKYRGLKALESAHLISVVRRPRRNPVVTVLEAAGHQSGDMDTQSVSEFVHITAEQPCSKNSKKSSGGNHALQC